MKKLTLILLTLLFTACGSKKFYTLGDNLNPKVKAAYQQSIDVVKVSVPKYLQEHKVVRQVSPYQIELVKNAHWLTPMEKKLTQVLIDYLQHSLNNPKVYLYPWQGGNEIDKRVEVDIKRFIASDNEVYLKANYKITTLSNNSSKIKNFETSLKTTKEIEEMMKSMERAYLSLLDDISTTLLNN